MEYAPTQYNVSLNEEDVIEVKKPAKKKDVKKVTKKVVKKSEPKKINKKK